MVVHLLFVLMLALLGAIPVLLLLQRWYNLLWMQHRRTCRYRGG
jgi:hypothetical protein